MNTPRSQAISTSWIRDALFELYKDYNGLPQDVFKDEVLPQQSDATVRKLYDKGFCGDEFRKAKETFFVSDFPDVPAHSGPMPGFETYRLVHGDGLELVKNALFTSIVALAEVMDANELGEFLLSCIGNNRLLAGIDLESLKVVAGKLSDVVEVSKLQIDWQDCIPPFKSCVELVQLGATKGKLAHLCELKDKNGSPLFKTAWDLRSVVQRGGSIERIQELSSLNQNEHQLFDNPEQYADALWHLDNRRDEFYACCKAVDLSGAPVFCYGEDLNDFLQAGGTAKEAIEIANVRASNGRRAFTGYEIALLKENDIPLETCASWATKGWDAVEQIYASNLKLTGVDFVNDGRPKALLLLPTNDRKQHGTRVFMHEYKQYFGEVSRVYDVSLRSMWSDSDASSAISEFGPQVALVVLSGHGNSERIEVAREVSRYDTDRGGKLTLDRNSYELLQSMKRIKSDTVFFLNSCATAEGAPNSGHFASFIAKNAKHLGLIAASAPFGPRDLVIDTVFPHSLKILSEFGTKENTYSAFDGVQVYQSRSVRSINEEQCRGRVRPSSVDISLVKGPLEPIADLDKCTKAKSLFSFAMRPPFDVEAFNQATLTLQEDGAEVIATCDYSNDTRQQSWQWLFGERLGMSWCPARGNDFGSESRRIFNDPLGFLTEKGMRLVEQPRDGDIVIYYARHDSRVLKHTKHPLDDAHAYHFGIYADGKVVSKPDGFPAMSHVLNFPYSDYSYPLVRYALFMRFNS
jgi:hypothetical protein